MRGAPRVAARFAPLGLCLLFFASACGDPATDASARAAVPRTKAPQSADPSPAPTGSPGRFDGYDYDILNWSRLPGDAPTRAMVAGWKRANLYVGASYVTRRPSDELVRYLPAELVSVVVSNVSSAAQAGWRYPRRSLAVIEDPRVHGNTGRLMACEWQPSFSLYRRSGQPVDAAPRRWAKHEVSMTQNGEAWVVRSYRSAGTCKRRPPR